VRFIPHSKVQIIDLENHLIHCLIMYLYPCIFCTRVDLSISYLCKLKKTSSERSDTTDFFFTKDVLINHIIVINCIFCYVIEIDFCAVKKNAYTPFSENGKNFYLYFSYIIALYLLYNIGN